MLIKQLIEVFDLLDSSTACGADIADYLRGIDPKADVEVSPLVGPRGKTDMVKIRIPGTNGKADCHMDGIILKPTLYLDGRKIIDHGEFLV